MPFPGAGSGVAQHHRSGRWCCATPCRLPSRERSGLGGDTDDALSRSVGAWFNATINNRLDASVALQGLIDWYIAEKDRTSSSIGRSLQAYLDTLDCSPYLKEIATPTLLLVGEESPTSTLDQQRFMAEQLPDCLLVVYPDSGPRHQRYPPGVVHPTGTGVSRFADHLRRQLCPTTCMLL